MTISNTEFDALLNDSSKRIANDIVWEEDEDHPPYWEFARRCNPPAAGRCSCAALNNPLFRPCHTC
jgi:hypothetical protein